VSDVPMDLIEQTPGCWEWHGSFTYGYARWGPRLVHRLIYERVRGRPITSGMDLDHLCQNRRCINPDHLEEVPRGENSRRAMEMLRWHNQIRRFLDTGRYESTSAAKSRRHKAKRGAGA